MTVDAREKSFTLAIDAEFPLGKKTARNGSRVELTEMGLFYIMYYVNPTEQEIKNIHNEAICISFAYNPPLLELVLQVGDNLVSDAPYSVTLYCDVMSREIMYPACIYVCLVDAETNMLRAMRIIGLPEEIRNFLYNVQIEQLTINMSEEDYDKCISYIQSKVSLDELVEMANCCVIIRQNNDVTGLIWEGDEPIEVPLQR